MGQLFHKDKHEIHDFNKDSDWLDDAQTLDC